MPKISVIVPIYNAEKYLPRCIDSILAQTFTDFELLLIDDGSTDGSGKICDEYATKDARIRVFHKKNGGVSSARNLGLDEAQGEWITFCDSDDYVYPCWLNNFSKNFSDALQMIVQSFDPKPLVVKKSVFSCDEGMQYMERQNILGYLWVKAFRKEIICMNHIRFNEQLAYEEDLVFVFRYLIRAKELILLTEDTGYFYNAPTYYKYKVSICNLHCMVELFREAIASKYKSAEIALTRAIDYLYGSFLEKKIDVKRRREWMLEIKPLIQTYESQNVICIKNKRLNVCRRVMPLDPNFKVIPYLFASLYRIRNSVIKSKESGSGRRNM